MLRIRAKNKLSWGGSVGSKAQSIVLVLAILGALGMLGHIIAKSHMRERFTEFYLFGLSSEAKGYLDQLMPREEGKVVAGIINREDEVVACRMEMVKTEV